MVGSIFGQQQNRSRSGLFPQLKQSVIPVGLFGIDLRQLVVIDVSGSYPDGPGFAGIPGLIALPTPEAAAEPPAPKALLRGLVRLIPPQRIDLFQERLPAKMEMVLVARTEQERVPRLEKAIEDSLIDWPLASVVEHLQALRGVKLICATTFMVEIGDVRRLSNPRQLMGYLGVVPSKRSTGESIRRSSITKTGNARVRRVLAQSAWTYRYPAKVGVKKYFESRHMPEAVRDIAWKAQARLTKRYRSLTSRGKRSTVAITAVARELAAFMWAIAQMNPEQQIGA